MKKSNEREIFEKASKVFILRVLGYVFGFGFTWVIASKYGPDIQGCFAIAFMFLSLFTMISKLGLETALVKWIAIEDDLSDQRSVYSKVLRVTFFSSLIMSIILFLLSDIITQMYNMPAVEQSLKITTFCIPFLSMLEISSNFFKGKKQVQFFGMYYHFGRFLFPFIIILFFFYLNIINYEVPIIAFGIGLILLVIISQAHVHLVFKKDNVNSKKWMTSTKDMIFESYPMMLSSSIVLFMSWSDVFVLGFFVDEVQIGIYSTAVKVATALSFIYNAVITISTPKIAEFYKKKNKIELDETISFSSSFIFITGLPIFFILFIFAESFLSLFGESYIQGKYVLRLILIAQLTNIFTGAVGPIFQMTGKQKKLQELILYSLFINLALSITLVQFYSIEGVAFASALGMIFWNIAGAVYLYRKIDVKTWVSLLSIKKMIKKYV